MKKDENQDLNLLIAQYISGELSEEKQKIAEEWIKLHPEEYAFLKAAYNEKNLFFDTDKAWNDVSVKLRFRKNRIRRLSIWLSTAAAVLLVVFFSKELLLNRDDKAGTQAQMSGVYTTKNFVATYSLPDGTVVKLDRNTVFSYDWNDRSKRLTHLKGEAYFAVAKNPNRPFVIKTDYSEVTVLGTRFIVDTRFNHKQNLIFVKEGIVNVRNTLLNKEHKLYKGDCFLSDNERLEPYSDVDRNEYAWVEEKLIFDNQPLSKVVKSLESYFEKTIIIEGNADKCMVTATFTKQSLNDILNELQMILNLKYKEVDGKYIIFDLKCM